MTVLNASRVVGLRGAKAAITAFTSALEEAEIAYATDTGQFGLYTGGFWIWFTSSDGVVHEPIVLSVTAGVPDFLCLGTDLVML